MSYCIMCDNTGVYLEPKDEVAYDKAFDYYDHMGVFNHNETRKKALQDVGYSRINPCPHCGKSPADYQK